MSSIDPWIVFFWLVAVYIAGLVFLKACAVMVQKRIEALDVAREAVRMRLDYDAFLAQRNGDDAEQDES